MIAQTFATSTVAPIVSVLSPADFVDVAYTPDLLLPCNADATLLSDATACEEGFKAYFERMYEDDEKTGDEVFIPRYYARYEVFAEVKENVTCRDIPYLRTITPLAWCVGFELGWLSALALTDSSLALLGVGLLEQLARSEQQKERAS